MALAVDCPSASSCAGIATGEIELEVSLLGGRCCTIPCLSTDSLDSLRPRIAEALGVCGDGDAELARFWLLRFGSSGAKSGSENVPGEPSAKAGCHIPGNVLAAELAGYQLVAVATAPEPEWCAGKRFQSNYLRGRRCGMEETSEDIVLELHRGGKFTYHRHDHDHDAECHYMEDVHVRAHGTWVYEESNAGDAMDGAPDANGGRIVLTGEAETSTEQLEEPERKETKPFELVLRKGDLLTPDKGFHVRGGWKVTPPPA